MNLCGACGLDFASLGAFDAHRRGRHAYLADASRPDGRSCLTLDELAEAGLELDPRDRWRLAADARRALARYGATAETPEIASGVGQDAQRGARPTPEPSRPLEAHRLNRTRAEAAVCSDCGNPASLLLGYCLACGNVASDREKAAA